MLRSKDQSSEEEGPTQREKSEGSNRTDYGIQVDLNFNPEAVQEENCNNENLQTGDLKSSPSAAQRRKQAKKAAKKRKREKSLQMQREARRQIGNIIQEFYELTAHFQDYAEKIELIVELIYNNDFRDYLDQLIRMRVTYIQKSIWEYTQSILNENPFERNEDHQFYSKMVDWIYERFLDIEESSREIEKIINIYLKYAYQKNESKEEIVYHNLAVNTFNYMIETDQTLKNLLHICEKKISPNKEVTRKKLEELISLIDCFDDDDKSNEEESENSASCLNDDMSTGHSEEDQAFLDKRRRRKKIKESELTTTEESLTKRLEGLMIREERTPVRVPEDWLKKMRLKSIKYRV